ncbi:hypothetical protein Clacol_002800 [Clathrus columnatus]|uniref:Transcription factor Pcc1 n=1 Tax=Clathrus columnatus TaxID=1419009 RepID=A0AAV5A1Q4_9AGAM|nr:hypothetical protein Clacol_002800 [Clathrus columnatus]
MEHELIVRIPFMTQDHARLVCQVLEVDKELSAEAVERTFDVQGNILIVSVHNSLTAKVRKLEIFSSSFNTLTIRLARLTLNSFLENLDLVTRTLEAFADDATHQSHIIDTTGL